MKSAISRTSVILFLALSATSCWKYNDLPPPPLLGGECEYTKVGMPQETAAAEMNRIVGILENSMIGSSRVEVIRKSTYPSGQRVKRNKTEVTGYGLQIVFTCEAAAIKIEERWGYSSTASAELHLNERIALLQTGTNKALDAKTMTDSDEDCDSCTDTEGYSYACNCTTTYDYGWWLAWAQVNAGNARQKLILQGLDAINTLIKIEQSNPNIQPSMTDSLTYAQKILPMNSLPSEASRQFLGILGKIQRDPSYRYMSGKVIQRQR